MYKRGTFLIVFLLTLSQARGGNEVGGGGIAENNILYATQNLETFLNFCLGIQTNCSLNERERKLLTAISHSMPKERQNPYLIQFDSETANPGFFIIDGHERIAKTGYRVGDPIYFNRDLLYPIVAVVATPMFPVPNRPQDIPFAVSILVHELGHHQGERDHTFLDALGAKVQTAMRVYMSELDGGPFHRSLIVTALEFENSNASELLLRDSEKLFAIGDQISPLLMCKSDGKAPRRYSLWNLHWIGEGDNRTVRMRVILYCLPQGMPKAEQTELEVRFQTVTPHGQSALIQKETITVTKVTS